METIRKTVESKYAPKQTNVIWVDTSGDTPVEKHFIKGKWREMSGGGGSIPKPRKENNGNVLEVVKINEKSHSLIPTQQPVLIGGKVYSIENANMNYFEEGNTVRITYVIDGTSTPITTYSEIVSRDPDMFCEIPDVNNEGSVGAIVLENGSSELIYVGQELSSLIVEYMEGIYGYQLSPLPFEVMQNYEYIPYQLEPGIVYNFGLRSDALNIPTLNIEGTDNYKTWLIIFTANTTLTEVTSTDTIIWQNDDVPVPEANHHYEISISFDGSDFYATYMDFHS